MDITIVGAGKLGKRLAKLLSEENHNITVIDIREDIVDQMVETYDVQGVFGSGTHCDVLAESNIKSADLLIATTPSDENNILSCLIARRMGVANTIARVRDPEYLRQTNFMRNELGISMMINPDYAGALEIFRMLQFPSVINIETFSKGRIDMAEIKINKESPVNDVKISDISSDYRDRMLICAVKRNDEIFIPNGDFVIKENDRIHITGSHKYLGKIVKYLSGKKSSSIKNVMLIGGSRITIYLANLLASIGKNVIIVEKNNNKCKRICEYCPNASVLCGDANDYDFLLEIGIERMDAVVTLTDTDETNFLISMYSKNVGVSKNVTKINNPNLAKMLDEMGRDSHINISEITGDTITQYVRAKKSVNSSYMRTLYNLVDGQIEAIEFETGDYVSFIGKPLSSIKLKKNVLVAAINRKNKIIFPSGDDTVEKGDIVIVVSKEHKLNNLNDILA
ncbi:MAG: Trk system potassium transporter TrkA [Eubacterium sp.]|nr:Trk system potassium transporter TrkA [Eubacterium sp.]